jgi:hypothetical protein
MKKVLEKRKKVMEEEEEFFKQKKLLENALKDLDLNKIEKESQNIIDEDDDGIIF